MILNMYSIGIKGCLSSLIYITELSHPDKLAENKYKKETKNDENPHEASVFGIIKC